jgi:hypothetical protein
MRFEAIDRLRVEWDLDYDTIAGRLNSNNLFAGYSFRPTPPSASATRCSTPSTNPAASQHHPKPAVTPVPLHRQAFRT